MKAKRPNLKINKVKEEKIYYVKKMLQSLV